MTLDISPTFTWNETVWNPSMIQTALWLDANDSATVIASGGVVSQWNDKSGGGVNFAQASSSLRPTTLSAALNGKTAISFDGIDDYLSAGDALDNVWTAAGGSWQIIWVARNDNVASGNGSILTKTSGSPADNRQLASYLRSSTSQLVTLYTPDAANYTVINANTTIANDQWVILSQAYEDIGTGSANTTSRVEIALDGTVQVLTVVASAGSLSTIDNTVSHLAVGAAINTGDQNSGNLSGEIAELLVLPAKAAVDTRQRIEGYLAHKWGLAANLPADHPYKNYGPRP